VSQPQALFITLEGIEGSGKSTQIRRISRLLDAAKVAHVQSREPGRTPVSEAVRGILLDPRFSGMTPLTDLLLYNAARAQHLAEVIEPALAAGKTVLCDRFKDSTVAYQGHASGFPLDVLALVHALPGLARDPDLTLLLDLPVEIGLERARARKAAAADPLGRFEDLDLSFHRKVRDGYLELARSQPGRIVVIDARGDEEEVFRRVRPVLDLRLGLED
jgi:dTMP kinase